MYRPFRIFAIVLGALLLVLGIGAVLWLIFGASLFPVHYFFFGPFFGVIFVLFLLFFGLRLLLLPWGWYGGRRAWRNYDPAMDTLRQRYARGEITKEQFEQMKNDLQQNNWQRRN